MSRKKKKTMGNIEIKDAQDLEQEEESSVQPDAEETQEQQETVNEEEKNSENESGECTQEAAEDLPQEEKEPEDAPKKKERKLKWAKNAEKESREAADKTNEFQEKLAEANDRYARLFAEFDNFRKRTEKEKAQRYDFGAKDMAACILPVIDNFERGLAAACQEGKEEDSFVKGMEMTYKQLLKALEDVGVKPIEAVGKEFNPDYHNAVMHVDDPEAGENIIVEEFQKGYMYKDQVIRYSMVKVAN